MYTFRDLYHRRMGGPSRKLLVVSYRSLPGNTLATIEEDDFVTLLTNDALVQDYVRTIQVQGHYPSLRLELVLAQNPENSRWYRCAVIEQDGDKTKLFAVDWCIVFVTTVNHIRVCFNLIYSNVKVIART